MAAEELTNKEAEMREEKVRYDAKRVVTVRQKVVEDKEDRKSTRLNSSHI